jgi:hypothetical protein
MMTAPASSWARRLFAGRSADFLRMVLRITEEAALIPVFPLYWTGETLAAWLAIYAIGNLAFIVDAGLPFRAIHRFLQFKSGTDAAARGSTWPCCGFTSASLRR